MSSIIEASPISFTALLSMKTDIDTWHSRRMSIQTSPRRFSFPVLRRGSRSIESYFRHNTSSKSTSSLSSREKIILHNRNSYTRNLKRHMSADSSPITFLLRDSPQETPKLRRVQEDDFKVELQRTVLSWQPKTDNASPTTPRFKHLLRSKTAKRKSKDEFNDDEKACCSLFRRHSFDTTPADKTRPGS